MTIPVMTNQHGCDVLNYIVNSHPENRDELIAFISSLSGNAIDEYVRVAEAVLGLIG